MSAVLHSRCQFGKRREGIFKKNWYLSALHERDTIPDNCSQETVYFHFILILFYFIFILIQYIHKIDLAYLA